MILLKLQELSKEMLQASISSTKFKYSKGHSFWQRKEQSIGRRVRKITQTVKRSHFWPVNKCLNEESGMDICSRSTQCRVLRRVINQAKPLKYHPYLLYISRNKLIGLKRIWNSTLVCPLHRRMTSYSR